MNDAERREANRSKRWEQKQRIDEAARRAGRPLKMAQFGVTKENKVSSRARAQERERER